jgi:succinoglycan biosynthesis protein ExoA
MSPEKTPSRRGITRLSLPLVAPRVSVVIPAYDEADHIEACVLSVLSQRVEGEVEVLVVDGRSSDGTAEIARRAGADVIDNSRRRIPSALNLGLERARGEVLLRFDAHSEMPPGYIDACLRALDDEVGAVNVGGWSDIRATGPWGRALRAVLASRFGVSNPRLWRRPPAGATRRDVESVPFGCFRADVIRAAGGWCERLNANEDYELNYRLRRAGGRIVFDPRIRSIYHPRESVFAIARQYGRHGFYKAAVLVDNPRSVRARHLAPPLLAITALAAASNRTRSRAARRVLLVYALVVGVETARGHEGWRTAPVMAMVHFAWASGLLVGSIAALARAAIRSGGTD